MVMLSSCMPVSDFMNNSHDVKRWLICDVVAYMAAGWQGSEGEAPGFPKDGSWAVKQEGLLKAP